MRLKIFIGSDGHDNQPKKKFCILPHIIVKATLPSEYYIVWWEWVKWDEAYKDINLKEIFIKFNKNE